MSKLASVLLLLSLLWMWILNFSAMEMLGTMECMFMRLTGWPYSGILMYFSKFGDSLFLCGVMNYCSFINCSFSFMNFLKHVVSILSILFNLYYEWCISRAYLLSLFLYLMGLSLVLWARSLILPIAISPLAFSLLWSFFYVFG